VKMLGEFYVFGCTYLRGLKYYTGSIASKCASHAERPGTDLTILQRALQRFTHTARSHVDLQRRQRFGHQRKLQHSVCRVFSVFSHEAHED
jgi:hypothetical protein